MLNKDSINKMLPKFFIIIVVFACLWLGIVNIKANDEFLEVSLYNIINLIIAVIIAYYFTQRKNDERKLKEKAEEIMNKIQIQLTSRQACNINSKEDIEYVLIMQRSISNWLRILDSIKVSLEFETEIDYINEKFKNYKEFTGNHIQDIDYLSKSKKELDNYTSLIDNKLDEIKVLMYK